MDPKKEFEDIEEMTGVTASNCECKKCQQSCRDAPCIGTPTDILNLVKAGHKGRLVRTQWNAGIRQNIPPIGMIQPYYDPERMCCSFMDATRKKCMLHEAGLKPTEGRLMSHNLPLGVVVGVNLPIEHAVALTWTDPENIEVIMEIVNELKVQGCAPSEPPTDSPTS